MDINAIKNKLGMRNVRTFRGGVHPDDMKSDTNEKPIVDIPASEIMVFPLVQHIGAAAVPCVSVGERVLMGQKIAEAGGYLSANIHSSVSGTVEAIEERPHPNGTNVRSIVIRNDFEDEACPPSKCFGGKLPTPEETVKIVGEAGIVGMGGAAFPTHVKLNPPKDKKIEYVIVNGAECEPYLTSDHREMLENPYEVTDGLRIIMNIFGLKKGYVGIETNKPDAIEAMKAAAEKESEVEIEVVPLWTKYPQGSEKQLIEAVTGRAVPPGKLPMDVGVIVDNVDTCAAVARAVRLGTPLIDRIVTVGGDCVKNPSNFRVRIGTDFKYVLEKCGMKAEAEKVIMGGPMMGLAVSSLDVPVIKGTSGILAFGEDMLGVREKYPCLRCGKCVDGCPMHLVPNALKAAADREDFEEMKKLNIADCISCGSCTFVCPAERNPLAAIRTGKAKLGSRKRREAEK